MRLLLLILALLLPAAAPAADAVNLSSAVFVERSTIDAAGRHKIVLEAPKMVTPGDRLVFILAYRNEGAQPAANFIVTNPLPQAVAYQGSADTGTQVSVDGGRSWGSLPALRVRDSDGALRAARPEDVTHVRWAMRQPIPAGGRGQLSFRGIVR